MRFNKIVGVTTNVLSSLDSSYVLISGYNPCFIGLKRVYFSFNQLSEVIPEEIGKTCGKFEHLDLSFDEEDEDQ